MIPDMNFNFEDLNIRADVRMQWKLTKDLNPPEGMSSEDLLIWRDEARKINQDLILRNVQ